jgi:hypothetical protein
LSAAEPRRGAKVVVRAESFRDPVQDAPQCVPRAVHPDLERFCAKRMGAATTELNSSHVPMLSQPRAVLDVIHAACAAVVAKPA